MVDQIQSTSTSTSASASAKLTAYVQANGGYIKDVGNNLGVEIGAELTKGNNHLEAEVGAGTNLTAKLEAGHTFDIATNMGLDLSLTAQSAVATKKTTVSMIDSMPITGNDVPTVIKYSPNSFRGGAKAQLQFKPSEHFTLKVGGEAGYKIPKVVKLEQKTPSDLSTGEHVELVQSYNNGARKGWYATPTVEAELKTGKHFSFTANADAYQGNLGVKYTF